ncbi:MAG: serine acetyltransferase [Pseudomonadota bacterium]
MFKNIRKDFTTHNKDIGSQGFWVMVTYRFGRWRYGISWRPLRMFFSLLYKILYKFTQIVTGVELPCEAIVGENFRIDHFGGIIISGYAVFGDNCVVRNGVTVGLKNIEDPIAPHFGNNVDIGSGAKVLGAITIGDNVKIGANAVVLHNLPSNCIAVGVPAKVIKTTL